MLIAYIHFYIGTLFVDLKMHNILLHKVLVTWSVEGKVKSTQLLSGEFKSVPVGVSSGKLLLIKANDLETNKRVFVNGEKVVMLSLEENQSDSFKIFIGLHGMYASVVKNILKKQNAKLEGGCTTFVTVATQYMLNV